MLAIRDALHRDLREQRVRLQLGERVPDRRDGEEDQHAGREENRDAVEKSPEDVREHRPPRRMITRRDASSRPGARPGRDSATY